MAAGSDWAAGTTAGGRKGAAGETWGERIERAGRRPLNPALCAHD